jgi:hypothetical protein
MVVTAITAILAAIFFILLDLKMKNIRYKFDKACFAKLGVG